MTALTISGPYQYPHDLHPSLRIDAPDRIVATVYVVGDDEERARREAEAIVAALSVSEASPEESGRFTGADGVPMVSVTVAQSFPFAKALVHEWGLVDGRDHAWKLKHKALVLPAATYDAILDRVRLRLRPGAAQ